jgi:HD-GYP domain-containing protein (c-di-GMP phosphodiesterase class II)
MRVDGGRHCGDGHAPTANGVSLAALARSLERADPGAIAHGRAVAALAVEMGRQLELDEITLAAIEVGATLHDVGKLLLSPTLLCKGGPLTETEWELMRTHPSEGERLLAHVIGSDDALAIVRSHHERWDGEGYPSGLMGAEIPLSARIVAPADAFHAMTHDRPYRPAMSHSAALLELIRNAGSQFDAECIETLLRIAQGLDSNGSTRTAESRRRNGSRTATVE